MHGIKGLIANKTIIFRIPGYMYPCTCKTGCIVGDKAQCKMNKLTRNTCKMCRYTKCKSAGMSMKLVRSAYITRVDKHRSSHKKKESINSKNVFPTANNKICHEKSNSPLDETISNMKQNYDQAFVIDMKVIR